MFYKNMKAKVCSLDADRDFFKSVAGVLQGNTLFRICLDSVLQTTIDLIKKDILQKL